MYRSVAAIALVVVLGLVNWSIAAKERHLAEGRAVYLRLAPVDPRSLMQGDYMALRFELAEAVYAALPKLEGVGRWRGNVDAKDGHVVVSLDARHVASFVRLYNGEALADNEILMQYRVRNHKVKFATNAFFFQEGHGAIYDRAKYGLFRVNDGGELLLASMHDDDLVKLEPAEKE